ncbi:MAG: 2-oxoacid:acceptor oxidoreductase family protein [candidate division WOR-3 bacterium]|nr:MAG: 2-oxoacid:acceptor oxidoreductase family protein [candidate division WOR-3 bacterium]
MAFRYEFRLSGSGGQGLILAGKILAEAAAIYDGKNATQSQSYGPEARGGSSRSEIIISDEEIDYPKAVNIDLLLVFTQEACDKYCKDIREGGILLADSEYVTKVPTGNFKTYFLPITEIAEKEVGKALVANIVALGMITELTHAISKDAVESAILSRVPKGTEDLNRKAFTVGINAVKRLIKKRP